MKAVHNSSRSDVMSLAVSFKAREEAKIYRVASATIELISIFSIVADSTRLLSFNLPCLKRQPILNSNNRSRGKNKDFIYAQPSLN
jgi:hypothetical protein